MALTSTASPRATLNRFHRALLFGLLGAFALRAEEVDPKPSKKIRRPIRLISRGEIKAAGNYRVLPLAEAQEAPLSERASDILQKQSGIQVNRAGAPGTQSLLGLRGSNPDQIEYFIEGMPLAKPLYAPLNLENVPLPLFQSVEIFPSFVPSHLPATNLGGALNFRLRTLASDETRYLTQMTANSLLGSSIAAARISNQSLNFINIGQSQNHYYYTANNGTVDNPTDDYKKLRTNEDFSKVGYTNFFKANAGKWKLSSLVDILHSERGLPGTLNMPLNNTRKRDDRAAVAFKAERNITEAQTLNLMATAAFDSARIDDVDHELIAGSSMLMQAPQALAGAGYAWRKGAFDAALHLRAKYQTIRIDGNTTAERQEGQGALNLAWDKPLFRAAVQASGTVGHDTSGRNAFFATPPQTFVQNGISGSALVAFRPLAFFMPSEMFSNGESSLEFYAQASSAYRPPTLYERFGDNVFVTPSASLKSEQALTNAGGIKGSLRCFGVLVCSARSEVYLTGAHDYIIFTQNSARTLIAVNASSAQIFGFEGEGMINWTNRFLLTARYTYLNAVDYGNIPYYQDKYLPFRPRHQAVGMFTFILDSYRINASLEYRGAVFRDRYNSYSYFLASKVLVDFGVDYIVNAPAKHTFSFVVKNITDNTIVDIVGYTVPGRYFLFKWMAEI